MTRCCAQEEKAMEQAEWEREQLQGEITHRERIFAGTQLLWRVQEERSISASSGLSFGRWV